MNVLPVCAAALAIACKCSGGVFSSSVTQLFSDTEVGRRFIWGGRSWWLNGNGIADRTCISENKKSIRFSLLPRDKDPRTYALKIPTERNVLFGDPNDPWPWRREIWNNFDFNISRSSKLDSKWLVLTQWHAKEDPGDEGVSPYLAVEIMNGRLEVVTRSDSSVQQLATRNPKRIVRYSGSVRRGAWIRITTRVKFDWTGQAQLQMWRDGSSIVDLHEIPIGYNDKNGPHFGFGVYRYESSSPIVVCYANLKFAFNREGLGNLSSSFLPKCI